jgi:uncharacterized protein
MVRGLLILAAVLTLSGFQALAAPVVPTAVELYPLNAVRVLDGPFATAADVNRDYLLALKPDRLLAPFFREAGLEPKAPPYGNWESLGLDGHTAGHYLSALANMIAAGEDTPDGELRRRLDDMLEELDRCQTAYGDGYIGGVPGSHELWREVAAGNVRAVGRKWVPWYNVHKTFAGLRDVYVQLGNPRAFELLIKLADWSANICANLSDDQMQQMLGNEHGGMNEVLADVYALTGETKYLELARRFNHRAVVDPLIRHEDKLTGLHANTQIPKIVGMARIAALAGDERLDDGARYFWENVAAKRSVAFGGNSVGEHFNNPGDFHGMLEHREGPETCNTYNMLRLTEQLFAAKPAAAYADYYERALYNHILASIHPTHPGYVYFTPIRPQHYRVYSQPETSFWCCVGTGMENPGKYGAFIYAKAKDDIYVNLFIPSDLKASDDVSLHQETKFPFEPSTRITLRLKQPKAFALLLRHPAWVAAGAFQVKVNGEPVSLSSQPSSYAELRREWQDGDIVELSLPMHTTVERLPDGSDWVAILHGPLVLAAPSGSQDLAGLNADGGRMGHVAAGPTVPLDRAPVLLTTAEQLPAHVEPDPAAGPLHFRLTKVVAPPVPAGLPLVPFFTVHDTRYQMYWELTTPEKITAQKERLAAEERAKAALEAATIDQVAPGEQQPEVEHELAGEGLESGIHNGRRWRHGNWFQYVLDPRGEEAVELAVTYSGDDAGRKFDIVVNGQTIATQELTAERRGGFVEKRYPIPPEVLSAAPQGQLTFKLAAPTGLAGGIFDIRLLRAEK